MKLSEYASYDGLGLAELVRQGDITPRELADLALAAIEQLNPKINAVVGLIEEETEASLARSGEGGPFDGVPFLIKDLGISYAGVLSEMGSRLGRGVVAPHDSELAIRLKRSGVVTLGRTNTPEFGVNASAEPVANGPTRNPWDLGRIAGGSSGGSAAAVAAGMVPLGHANDGAGSIRFPAACCGVFGLKPSRGRVSFGPDADELAFGLGSQLALSRSVRDSAAMLDAIEGLDVGTRLMLPPPERPYLEEAGRDPSPLRVAFSANAPEGGTPVDRQVCDAINEIARLCEELGHEVREGAPGMNVPDLANIFLSLASPGIAGWAGGLAEATGRPLSEETLEATTLEILEYGRRMTAIDLLASLDKVNTLSRSTGRFFETCDVWLSPVTVSPPIELGVLDANAKGVDGQAWFEKIFSYGAFTTIFNATGQPAMSMPLCWSGDGLPIGIQFAAGLGREDILFQLAGQLERARPWRDKRPPLSI
ncbi:MAG: amidase [Pseudomonadales bacterium]|jgi:amidase|nr:amidase [Gammaproteobacteria bacterium]MDP7313454.1 amidase [Pseudomonadales bacterium]|tara:strand:+ start:4570 stop:6009 length:1440 start_codon:yes stop_codon:yes gene_type:complete